MATKAPELSKIAEARLEKMTLELDLVRVELREIRKMLEPVSLRVQREYEIMKLAGIEVSDGG